MLVWEGTKIASSRLLSNFKFRIIRISNKVEAMEMERNGRSETL